MNISDKLRETPEKSRNSPFNVDSKYVVFEKPDCWTKTGFQDPGHKNQHNSCLDGTEPYCKGIIMISTKTKQPCYDLSFCKENIRI